MNKSSRAITRVKNKVVRPQKVGGPRGKTVWTAELTTGPGLFRQTTGAPVRNRPTKEAKKKEKIIELIRACREEKRNPTLVTPRTKKLKVKKVKRIRTKKEKYTKGMVIVETSLLNKLERLQRKLERL